MATEKLAKGFRTPLGAGPHEYTHKAFREFLTVALGNTKIRARLGMANKYEAYRLFLQHTVKPLAEAVENLSPEGEDHPNPEYPWMDTSGNVTSPLDHSFRELSPRTNPEILRLLYFVEACLGVAGDEIEAATQNSKTAPAPSRGGGP